MNGRYSSVQAPASAQWKVEGSRFIADLVPAATEDDAGTALASIRKKYFDATHHCYAYVIGAERAVVRYADDGEPSGTAGVKIYAALRARGISDVLCVVTRYFGGTKLGGGGLGRAYYDAALHGIRSAVIVTKEVVRELLVQYPFTETNPVMKVITAHRVRIAEQHFNADGAAVTLLLPPSDVEIVKAAIVDATRASARIVIGGFRTEILR